MTKYLGPRLILSTLFLIPLLLGHFSTSPLYPFPFTVPAGTALVLSSVLQLLLGVPLYVSILMRWKNQGSKFTLAIATLTAYTIAIVFRTTEASNFFFLLSAVVLYAGAVLEYLTEQLLQQNRLFLDGLQKLKPQQTLKKNKTEFEPVDVSTLNKGDIIKIRVGDMIPLDGIITAGTTSVDESQLTGNQKPLPKGPGDVVVGGSLNRDSDIVIQITQEKTQHVFDRILDPLQNVYGYQLPLCKKIEQACQYVGLLGLVITCATFYFLNIVQAQPLISTFKICLAVLLSFASVAFTPALMIASYFFAQQVFKKGIIIKTGQALETLAKLQTLFFDKTGTMTKGDYECSQTFTEIGTNQGELLQTLFSLGKASQHPLLRALETHPWFNEISKYSVKDFREQMGLGASGYVQPKGQNEYFASAGNLRFIKRMQMNISRDMKNKMDDLETMGETVLLCGYRGQVKGLISFADILRSSVRNTFRDIQRLKVEPAIMTGNSEEDIAHLITNLKLKKIYPRCTPEEKANKIAREKNEGKITGFVGAPDTIHTVTTAQVNLVFDTGTNIYDQKADVIFMNSDFQQIAWLIQKTKGLYRFAQSALFLSLCFSILLAGASVIKNVSPLFIILLLFFTNVLFLKKASSTR